MLPRSIRDNKHIVTHKFTDQTDTSLDIHYPLLCSQDFLFLSLTYNVPSYDANPHVAQLGSQLAFQHSVTLCWGNIYLQGKLYLAHSRNSWGGLGSDGLLLCTTSNLPTQPTTHSLTAAALPCQTPLPGSEPNQSLSNMPRGTETEREIHTQCALRARKLVRVSSAAQPGPPPGLT